MERDKENKAEVHETVPSFEELVAKAKKEIAHPHTPRFEEPKWWWSTKALTASNCTRVGGDDACRRQTSGYGTGWNHGWRPTPSGVFREQNAEVAFFLVLGVFVSYLASGLISYGLRAWMLVALAVLVAVFFVPTLVYRLQTARWAMTIWAAHAEDRARLLRKHETNVKITPVTYRNEVILTHLKDELRIVRDRRLGPDSELAKAAETCRHDIEEANALLARHEVEIKNAGSEMQTIMTRAMDELQERLNCLMVVQAKHQRLSASIGARFDALADTLGVEGTRLVQHRLIEQTDRFLERSGKLLEESDALFRRTVSDLWSDLAQFNERIFRVTSGAASPTLNAHGLPGEVDQFDGEIDETSVRVLADPTPPSAAS